MLRGTNRSVIEINETGSKYFEKVLVFVRPEFSARPTEILKKDAIATIQNYTLSALPTPIAPTKKTPKKHKKQSTAAALGICAPLTAAVLWLLFKLIF